MFRNYLKIAFRHVKQHKGYSFINVSGLAIGMACCILILLWVQEELSFDQFHENADDIYRLTTATPTGVWSSSAWALMPTLKKEFPEVNKGTWYGEWICPVRHEEKAFNERCALVSPEFFEIFNFPFKEGDSKTAFASLNSAVITEKTAKKYFGERDPIGQVIHFDNRVDLAVTGVIENVPSNSSMQFDFLTHPVHVVGEGRLQIWSADCASYVLLHKNINVDEFGLKIKDTINKHRGENMYKLYAGLQPLKKIHLYSLNGTDPVVYVYLFSAVAVIVLLIAGINFVNLSTARSSKRAKEVGMRKVLGASVSKIVGMLSKEFLILVGIANVIAWPLAYVLMKNWIRSYSYHTHVHLWMFFGAGIIALLIAFFTVSYQSIKAASKYPVESLKYE
ncbi:MAG TPA: ABC transporter permease [Acidobacteriota bacterium]|nr:ABC transporter permease [Acidobacteriota bacterium]